MVFPLWFGAGPGLTGSEPGLLFFVLKRLPDAKTHRFPVCFGRDALFWAVLRMPLPMASGCALSTHWPNGIDRLNGAKTAQNADIAAVNQPAWFRSWV
jgi:hypothetical protein